MASTGLLLKKQLGLNKFKIVRIQRSLDIAISTYRIFIDSRRPNFPITNAIVNHIPLGAIYNGNKLPNESSYTPLMDIEEFNPTTLKGRTFIVIDLAGKNLIDNKMHEKENSLQTKVIYYPTLEEITLFDLRDKDLVSQFTKGTKAQRQKLNKSANKNTKLIEVDIKGKDIIFKFLTEATNIDEPKFEVEPKTFDIKPNTSKTYEIWLQFPNALDLLEVQKGDKINQEDLQNLLEASDVQLWNNSPSFHWQGFNYNNTQLDSAIFPTNVKPKQWDKIHGDQKTFLDKHTSQLIDQIQFFLPQMAAKLEKELKNI